MTDPALRAVLATLAAADPTGPSGLPTGATLDEVAAVLPVDLDAVGSGDLGDPGSRRAWVAVASPVYEGGLRVWVEADAADVHAGRAGAAFVLLVDGTDPVDEHGEPARAPDLGPPEATGPVALGRLLLPDGERVYASAGLAVLVNPENGLLLGLRGFVPTDAADYAARLRPVLERAGHPPTRAGAR